MVFLQLSESLRERSVGNQGQGGRRARNLRAKKKRVERGQRKNERWTSDVVCSVVGRVFKSTQTQVLGKGPSAQGPWALVADRSPCMHRQTPSFPFMHAERERESWVVGQDRLRCAAAADSGSVCE